MKIEKEMAFVTEKQEMAEELADYEDREEAEKWIPVSERLPEELTNVMVTCFNAYTHGRSIEVAFVSRRKKWCVFGWPSDFIAPKITAWKPFPEVYEEETK